MPVSEVQVGPKVMNFISTDIKDLYVADLSLIQDARGGFERIFCSNEFKRIGLSKQIVQINHSYNINKGTVRGFHYQAAPFQECKLIRCIKGSVLDVVIDIRKDSPTFRQKFEIKLSGNSHLLIIVPEGLAHGFQTLEDDSQLIYHHTEYYSPESSRGIRYNDPFVDMNWPIEISNISDNDLSHPILDQKFNGI